VDAARWTKLQDLFIELREAPPGDRERSLAAVAADDREMADELRSLLAADPVPGVLDAQPLASVGALLSESPPERVGPYVVVAEIGHGGMGVVYRAHDPRLRRDVALKLLPRALVRDTTARDRFITEARAASALDHPNICTIFDIGELDDGRLYLAMALCARGTLADRLTSGRSGVGPAVDIASQVAGALDAAHEAGIVHRDVKPHNIAFGERGEARLLDFGIAMLGGAMGLDVDATAGTPAYMAPEQVRGERVDRRVDVWSLGVVLFEMLAGQRPFGGGAREAVLASILHDEPPDVRALAPEVPSELARVVARALRKDPDERYATAAEMHTALRGASTDIARAKRRGRVRALVGAVAAVALVAAGLAYLRGGAGASAGLDPSADAGIDPRAVVVLPFRVSGDPALAYLREGLVDLLAARLTGEGGLRAADTRTVYSGWRAVYGERTTDLPADTAVQFARRLGAAHVLLGDVVGTSQDFVVNASVLDAGGRTVGRASAAGPHERLAELVDRLVAELLSVSAGEDPRRLATLTSTSLPALRAYLDGQAAYRRGAYETALLSFNDALEYDSTFALAGLGLALASGWLGGAEHMRERGFDVAWRFRDRLSERDRAFLIASVGPDFPEPPSVVQLLDATQRALATSPDRAELWYGLGDLYFHYGRVVDRGEWRQQAEGAFRRALELDPEYAPPIHHLVALYASGGQTEALRSTADAYLGRDSIGATADYIRWRAAHALGDPSLAGVAIDSMDAEALIWVEMNTMDEGFALDDGKRAAELLGQQPGTNAEVHERLMGLHSLHMNTGAPALARRTAEGLRALQPDRGFVDRLNVLSALYGDGDRAAADSAARALARADATHLDRCVLELWRLESGAVRNTPPDPPSSSAPDDPVGSVTERLCDAVVVATSEVRETDGVGPQLAALDTLMRSGPVRGPVSDGHSEYAHLALARLLEAAGDRGGALAAVRRRIYFIGWHPYLATSLREEARLAELAGEPGRALAAWTHYLALRGDPEPPLAPLTAEARAAVARLSAAPERR
jgi:serine/threonine-protein kinase